MISGWTDSTPKQEVIDKITNQLTGSKLNIVEENFTKPWGAYWRIDDKDIELFVQQFFASDAVEITKNLKQSPKILLIAPRLRLSWQYHDRRAEIWKIVVGPVKAARSLTDKQSDTEIFKAGDVINIKEQERHRLVGSANWSVVAEIWQHTDPHHPSDEEDNVRLQDDFGRQGTNTRN